MFHIVEDCPSIRNLMVELVTLCNRKTKSFADAFEYLKYLESDEFTKPCGIITDVHMPQMSGYEMMHRVLGRFPDIRFAVISGEPYIPGESKEQACLYLLKPFRANAIVGIIDKFVGCASDGIDSKHGCACFGDRSAFIPLNFQCPKLVKH